MMTLDEAIKHAEEVAEEQDKLCKRYDDASGYSRSHNESIRVADAKWCERCAKEHRQLAEWLKELKQLRQQATKERKEEPCEDAVSREDVIKAVDRHTFDTDDGLCLDEDISIILEGLPHVVPTQRWISCSEGLPEENGFYLATLDGEICGENEPFTGLAEYENGKWVDDEEDYQCVLAWMPLPQPYKESEDK